MTKAHSGRGTTGTLIATVLGSSLSFIDGSVMNVALPAIGRDMAIDANGIQWVINAYLLPLSALVLLGGALSDRLGRKRVFLSGVTLFAIAAIGSMLAQSVTLLHASRAVQGIGAAMFVPASLAILGADFEGPARGRAIGTWAGAGAVSSALGPILGGWLVDAFSWRAIFAMMLPLSLAAILLGAKFITPHQPGKDDTAKVDWLGALVATLSLGAFVWGLTMLSGNGGTAALIATGIGLVLALLFLWVEKRAGDHAMMPLALFATRTFTGVTVLTLILYAALAAILMLVPYLLIARGWPASMAGATLLPGSIIMGLGSTFAGRLSEKIGARPMLTVAPLVVGLGFAWLVRLPDGEVHYWVDLFPAMAIIGLGLTIGVTPLTTTVMTSVGEDHSGAASGVNNATSRVGGMIATALIGLALADGGRSVPTPAFHHAALVAALAALVSSAIAWWLIAPRKKGKTA